MTRQTQTCKGWLASAQRGPDHLTPTGQLLLLASLLWFVLPSSLCAGKVSGEAAEFANPICEQADPWFTQHNGRYLACFAEGNRGVAIHISDRMTVLGTKHVVWRAPESGPASREIWAPELHFLDGRWYVYFAASDGQNRNHRAWVLQSAGDDPLGPYTLHGPLYTGDDSGLSKSNHWAIDLTVFKLEGRQYAVWSGWADDQDIQFLYIAPMKDPLTIDGPRTRICANDDFLWERVGEQESGRGLNEAPEVLQRAGRTFITYSCSGSWQTSYKVGLLELKPGGDPLRPGDWKKFPQPAFQSSAQTFGVGHNSFLTSPDGTQDWLVYHAKYDHRDGWRRVVFEQPFHWDSNGIPVFGEAVAAGQALPLPSGEKIQPVTGTHCFSFASTEDLEGWSYYGHHQMCFIRDDCLHLGALYGDPANEFRSAEKIVLNGGQWGDFKATVKLRAFGSRGKLGMLFRVHRPAVGYNSQLGYFAGFRPGDRHVELGRTDGKTWQELASAAVPEPVPSELTLAVTAQGDEIQVDLQGTTLIQATDKTFSSGSVGLRVVDSHGAFSQLKIEPVAEYASSATPDAGVPSSSNVNITPPSSSYTNPVYGASMPDPSVIRYGDSYYAAGTTGDARTPDGKIFTLLCSHDLVHWESLGGALNPPLPNRGLQYWAPELTHNEGKYYLYYCVGGSEPEKFGLRVSSSEHPEGPYVDMGVQLVDCQSNRFTIDPFPFHDEDGKWYFFYARNFTNESPGVHAGTAIVVDRLLDMTRLAGDCHVVVRAKHDWTLYQAHRRMDVYGRTFDWHTIEGPCVVKHDGRYYCFYSGANWQTPRYGVDFVVADNPLGPYSDGGDHPRVLQGIPGHVRGPGHHSIVFGPEGKSQYILYHAWDSKMKEREMCADRLEWTPEGPHCTPTFTPQPSPK